MSTTVYCGATDSSNVSLKSIFHKLFQEITRDKTAIIVTHRLGSIKFVDRIIVLANEKVIESGTHNELINKKGLYCKLWETQVANYL